MMYRPPRILTGAAAVTATALLASSSIALAQEESPALEDPTAPNGEAVNGSAQAHPLHIHDGSCDQLGDVKYPLGEISTDFMVHGEAIGVSDDQQVDEEGQPVDGTERQQVALNLTLVAASLDDLTGAPHAINIHQSEEDMGTNIACGDITGSVFDGGTLAIRLNEVDGSGYIGFALFREDSQAAEDVEDVEVATAVYTMLTQKDATMTTPTDPATEDPAMSPAPEDEMSPAPEDEMSPAPEDGMSPAPEDEATGDGTTVTIEVEVEGDADVQVGEAEESPAA
jgi:hypothetical protein